MTQMGNNIVDESWTITQGGNVIFSTGFSGGGINVDLAYGDYHICHTVTINNGETCEWCQFIKYSGGDGATPIDDLPHPKKKGFGASVNSLDNAVSAVYSHHQVHINFTAPQQEVISYAIYNSLGRYIQTKTDVTVRQGKNDIVVEGISAEPGIYYVHVIGSNTNATSKILIQ